MLQQFDKQRNRGTQGFGLFDGQEMNMVHEANEDKILKWLVKYDSNLLLFHHRFPTSTVNVARAAHPFSTKQYFDKGKTQYILVHNGIIRNAKELQKKHEKDFKIKYQSMLEDGTFNDSEALLWEFALEMEGKKKDMEANGGIAFVCIKLVNNKLEKLYFGRNSSPLKLYRDKQGIALSSEGEGEMIDSNKLYTWHYNLKRLTNRQYTILSYQHSASTGTGAWAGGSYADGRYSDWDDGYDPHCGSCRNLTYACIRHDTWRSDDYYGNYSASTTNTERKLLDKVGDWVGDHLRKKYGDDLPGEAELAARLDKSIAAMNGEGTRAAKLPVIEYEPDPQTQILLPTSTVSRKTAEQILVLRKDMQPTEEEIRTEYMAYLAGSRGHFEQAYWAIECDYEDAEAASDTIENIRKRVVLEKVMEMIQTDPEYQGDVEAVSSVWEAIWRSKTIETV